MNAYQVIQAKPLIASLFPELTLTDHQQHRGAWWLVYTEPASGRRVTFKNLDDVQRLAQQRELPLS